jgi:hypothetical protein
MEKVMVCCRGGDLTVHDGRCAGALDDVGGHLAGGDVPDRLHYIDLVGDQRMVGAELSRKGQPFAIFGESNHHDRLGREAGLYDGESCESME